MVKSPENGSIYVHTVHPHGSLVSICMLEGIHSGQPQLLGSGIPVPLASVASSQTTSGDYPAKVSMGMVVSHPFKHRILSSIRVWVADVYKRAVESTVEFVISKTVVSGIISQEFLAIWMVIVGCHPMRWQSFTATNHLPPAASSSQMFTSLSTTHPLKRQGFPGSTGCVALAAQ